MRLMRGHAHNCRLLSLARTPAKRIPALVRLASPGTTLQAQLPAAIRIANAIRMAVAIAMAIELAGAPVVASRFPYPGYRPTGRLTPAVLWGFAPIPPRHPNALVISCLAAYVAGNSARHDSNTLTHRQLTSVPLWIYYMIHFSNSQ